MPILHYTLYMPFIHVRVHNIVLYIRWGLHQILFSVHMTNQIVFTYMYLLGAQHTPSQSLLDQSLPFHPASISSSSLFLALNFVYSTPLHQQQTSYHEGYWALCREYWGIWCSQRHSCSDLLSERQLWGEMMISLIHNHIQSYRYTSLIIAVPQIHFFRTISSATRPAFFYFRNHSTKCDSIEGRDLTVHLYMCKSLPSLMSEAQMDPDRIMT